MAFPKVDLTDVASFIDHHLSDDGRTDLGIKDEWFNIPGLKMKRSPWLSKSSWHHDLHKCQILDYFVDEMIEGQKCIIHPHPSQKLSPMSADGHLYFLVAEGLLVFWQDFSLALF